MSGLLRNTIYSLAVMAATLPIANIANAGERWRGGGSDTYTVRRGGGTNDGAFAAGIIGLAAGALIIGAITSQNNQPRPVENEYRHPRPRPDRDFFPARPERDGMRDGYGRWERGDRYERGYDHSRRYDRRWHD